MKNEKKTKWYRSTKNIPGQLENHQNLFFLGDTGILYSRWCFQIFFMFIPTWGRWTHFDEHIFQMGWFNHQLVTSISLFFFRCSNVSAFQFLNVFFRCPVDIWKCSTLQVDIDTLRFHRWLKLNHLKVDTVDGGHPAPPGMYQTL